MLTVAEAEGVQSVTCQAGEQRPARAEAGPEVRGLPRYLSGILRSEGTILPQ
jgi:hypothetical protein